MPPGSSATRPTKSSKPSNARLTCRPAPRPWPASSAANRRRVTHEPTRPAKRTPRPPPTAPSPSTASPPSRTTSSRQSSPPVDSWRYPPPLPAPMGEGGRGARAYAERPRSPFLETSPSPHHRQHLVSPNGHTTATSATMAVTRVRRGALSNGMANGPRFKRCRHMGGNDMFVYVGAYTAPQGSATGIEVFQFDSTTGALTPVQTVSGVANPTWLTFDDRQRYLFAAIEVDDGRVNAFARDAKTGELRPINDQPAHGAPCYLSLDPSGRYVLAANYTGSTTAVLPVDANGRLGEASQVIHHQGSGPRPEQEAAHPHMILPSPDGRFILVTDLGTDQVLVYRLDTDTGQLVPNDQGAATVKEDPGSGPRHFAFAPHGRTLYVINEL